MNPLVTNGIGMVLVVIVLVGTGWHFGSRSATKEYLPQLEALKAGIEAADAQAYETQHEQEKNHEQVEKSHADNVASVVKFYARMLREAGNKVGSIPAASGSKIVDGTPCECGVSKPDIEFARSCALDAVKVINFQRWVVANKFTIQ